MRLPVCLLCAVAVLASSSEPWRIENLPNPKTNPKACGRAGPSSVCDPDHLLPSSPGLDSALQALTEDYEYPGCGGYEMAVVVVRRISGGTEAATRAFAMATMDAWGVGKASCNNGVVLAIAVEDRHMHIATGRGAAEHIPDRQLAAVIERMKPLMREQRYSEAVEQCVSDVARILSGESLATNWLMENWEIIAFVIVISLCLCHSWWKGRRYNRCKRALSAIERERAEAKANRYNVTTCSICLESFENTKKRETTLLSCGHTFHTSCVDGWREARGTCPVCRHPTSCGSAHTSIYVPLQQVGAAYPDSSYEDEYRFRIHRARALYPDYVSQNMVDRWCAPGYTGPVVADTAFIHSSPNYQSSTSGSGGRSSFGGGCSSGGGGAGGSW
mmetsp:Transcript_3293/g.8541  ORF Transcript_3293/g.8541 Transcript_3293/m.8541 type:complete len:388 (+) Transcript_3293:98-1261(+)